MANMPRLIHAKRLIIATFVPVAATPPYTVSEDFFAENVGQTPFSLRGLQHDSGVNISAVRVLSARYYREALQYEGLISMVFHWGNGQIGYADFRCSVADDSWDMTAPADKLDCGQVQHSGDYCDIDASLSAQFINGKGRIKLTLTFGGIGLMPGRAELEMGNVTWLGRCAQFQTASFRSNPGHIIRNDVRI